MDDQRVVGVAPDISELTFIGALKTTNSPALSAGHAVYQYCVKRGVSPSFIIAMFNRESGMGKAGTATITHSWGNTRLPTHGGVTPVRMTTAGEARSGQFPVFKDWIDGGIATVARFVDYAPYQGKTTVKEIIPTWAPNSDGNDSAAYVRGVLAQMAAWRAQDKAASAAKGDSVAVPKPTVSSKPSPNRNGYGSPHDPKAICLHITAGSGASALSWLTSPASQASANYVNMEDGTVHELVPPTESAWANGAVNKPNLSNPIVAATLAAGRNMNTATISIENAGQTSGGKGGSLSAAQVRSLIALCAWLCQRFGIPADRDHIIPHAYVDSVNRPYCPGFSEAEWSSWVGQIAALVNGTSGKVPLTPVQQVIQEGIVAKFVEESGEGVDYGINEAGMPFTVIRWGGTANKVDGVNINDIGISVYDADNKLEDRSIQGGAFKPWALRGK